MKIKLYVVIALITFSINSFARGNWIWPLFPTPVVQLFDDINYLSTDRWAFLNIDRFHHDNPNLKLSKRHNNISSIKVEPDCIATLYEEINYQGRSETFSKDDSDLRDNWIGNDSASSVKIICDPAYIIISPPTSSFISQQNIDLVIIVKDKSSATYSEYSNILDYMNYRISKATFNEYIITDALNNCVKKGKLLGAEKGITFKCSNLPVKAMPVGIHTFKVEINFGDHTRVTKTVEWTILENEE
jgi:hypothetical protein